MSETTKKVLTIFAPYILMIIMIIGMIILWNGMQEAKTELEIYKRARDKEQTTFDINKPLGEVSDRETNVYPKLDRDIEALNKRIKISTEILKKEEANKPIKEKYDAKFKNKNFAEINQYFNSILVPPTNDNVPR